MRYLIKLPKTIVIFQYAMGKKRKCAVQLTVCMTVMANPATVNTPSTHVNALCSCLQLVSLKYTCSAQNF